MHCTESLPHDYQKVLSIALQKDKVLAAKLNGAAAVLALMLIVGMHFFVPLQTLFDLNAGFEAYLVRFGALLGGLLAYLVLHELTHAAAMKAFGCKKVRFGFTGLYAYAGSTTTYFDKTAYFVTALAPLVVWGVLFTVPLFFISDGWFWVFYLLQVTNLTGAAGDVYVVGKLSRLPDSILVQDTGIDMTIFDQQGDEAYENT